jgi:uncharacterized protein YceK
MKRIALTLITSFCLSACGGEDSKESSGTQISTNRTAAEIIDEMEKKGELPILDRSESLIGKDQNNNNIRDDIDRYITQEYKNNDQRIAVEQFAKQLQQGIEADKSDVIVLKKISFDQSRAVGCIYEKFPEDSQFAAKDVAQDLISVTTNTKQRLLAHIEMSKALDGTVLTLPEGDLCDE